MTPLFKHMKASYFCPKPMVKDNLVLRTSHEVEMSPKLPKPLALHHKGNCTYYY